MQNWARINQLLNKEIKLNILEDLNISGRVVVITGGAGMLGSQYADTILSSDGIPIILDINDNSIGQIELELKTKYASGDFITLNCDITDVDAVRQAKENILSKYSKISIKGASSD